MNEWLQLGALLAHAENGGLRRVAGPADAAWEAVAVGSGEAELTESGADRLAILTAGRPTSTWQQDALLRRLRDRGYTGLPSPVPAPSMWGRSAWRTGSASACSTSSGRFNSRRPAGC